MAGEGNRGSTSGLKFNPREAPEFIEQDRTHANGDPREQEKSEQKEIKEKKDRQKKLAGLRHIKVKIDQKKIKDDSFDSQAQVGEQAAQTGPPGMSAAFPPGGGLDAPIQMGEPIDIAWNNTFRKAKDKTSPTETLERVRSRERGRKAERTKRRLGTTTETLRSGAPKPHKKLRSTGGGLNVFARRITQATNIPQAKRQLVGRTEGAVGPRLETPARQTRSLTYGADPREKEARAVYSAVKRDLPMADVVPTIPFQTGKPPEIKIQRDMPPPPKDTATKGPKKLVKPKQPKVPGGKAKSPTLAKGRGTRAIASLASGVLSNLKDTSRRGSFTHADIAEIRSLLSRLKRIAKSDEFHKSFYNQKGDAEGPSPNAHPRQTSHPTGATEADPDDDPTMWGAHPIGLLAPRRGHQ